MKKTDPRLVRWLLARGFRRSEKTKLVGFHRWLLERPGRRTVAFFHSALLDFETVAEAMEYVERTLVNSDPKNRPPEEEDPANDEVVLAQIERTLLSILSDGSEKNAMRLRSVEALLVSRGFRLPR